MPTPLKVDAAGSVVAQLPPSHLDSAGCAARYNFSKRHWLRLVDAGRVPQPVRFGKLTRWPVRSLEAWEADDCPDLRQQRRTK